MCKGKFYLIREDMEFLGGFGCVKWKNSYENIILNKKELFELRTYKYEKRRISYFLGRIAAKKAISELGNGQKLDSVFIDRGVFGFPVVKGLNNGNVQVSISHTDEIAVAIAFPEDHPMAVDIEKTQNNEVNGILLDQMTKKEFEIQKKMNLQDSSFALFWSFKEALSKVLKTGLTLELKYIEIEKIDKNGDYFVATFSSFPQYKGVSFYSFDHFYSIVLPKYTTLNLDEIRNDFEKTLSHNRD